ncbi:hypothetical protein FHX85_004527 [Clostridium beijerinckii]|nr:hypothetical protein [Clostridium beijerinckii]NRX09317.1 hypothetical protein [Clostridium beijerinckii]NSA74995.1 hypothetical protein [Clostridium beijerinckii]NYE55442.1 hypothetical protein [Clostridium beijerinckii]
MITDKLYNNERTKGRLLGSIKTVKISMEPVLKGEH